MAQSEKSAFIFLNAYSGDGLVKELLEAFAFAGLALGVAPALVVGLLGDHTSPGAATREGLKVQPLVNFRSNKGPELVTFWKHRPILYLQFQKHSSSCQLSHNRQIAKNVSEIRSRYVANDILN